MFKLILSLIILLATIFFITPVVKAAPYGAGKYNSNVPYGGETQLSIATSGNISMSLVPSDAGTVASASGTVTVTSSDVVGYKLYIRSLSSTNMVNGPATIPASLNGTPAILATNTWGYNLDAGTNYIGITTGNILIRSVTDPYTGGDTTTVKYGVRVDNSKRAGNYSTTVVYTAVPQTN